KEQRENEERQLKDAIEQIKSIVKEGEINYKFKEKNNRTYSVMTLEKDLSEIDKSLIKGQVDNSIYHIEIEILTCDHKIH
ncbi:MAG: hypothetical protein J6J33_04750, partial [Clostridia bacterium]|nr:hypothetical protein [Clostridia bacterium]